MMYDREKSDRLIVPWTPPNNAGQPAAEAVEGSGRTKGNSRDEPRRPDAVPDPRRLAFERVRQAARRDRKQRFTANVNRVLDADMRGSTRSTTRGSSASSSTVWRTGGDTFPVPPLCHPSPNRRLAFAPKVGAGCGSAARPDLWRGRGASRVPTPTETAAER